MTNQQFQQCRQDFEQHFSGMDLSRWGGRNNPTGMYIAPTTSTAWVAWQAAYLKLLPQMAQLAAA